MFSSCEITHPGQERTVNEDAVLADDSEGIWLVADGMGGHAGGEVAAHVAVEQVYAALVRGDSLPASIERAHEAILERAQRDPALEGMGTTIVAARRKASKIDLAWVGDSRIYAFTGELIQLSSDHTFVQDLVQSGELSQEEADVHPQRNILRQALGQRQSQPLQVDVAEVNLKHGHRLLPLYRWCT